MRKLIAIIAAVFVGGFVALVHHRGYYGDSFCVFFSVYAAVYFGLYEWKEFVKEVLTK